MCSFISDCIALTTASCPNVTLIIGIIFYFDKATKTELGTQKENSNGFFLFLNFCQFTYVCDYFFRSLIHMSKKWFKLHRFKA